MSSELKYHNIFNVYIVVNLLALFSHHVFCINFKGIPAAFGDLDLNKRTDIVFISDDGITVDIYYQYQRQLQQSQALELGFSCKSEPNRPVIQVYLTDIDSDGYPNLLALLGHGEDHYQLMNLKVKSIDQNNSPPFSTAKQLELDSNTKYSLATAAALNGDGLSLSSNNSLAESLPLKGEPPSCHFDDLNMSMRSQPLLFDLVGDLRTYFMSLDKNHVVSVWLPPPPGSNRREFEKSDQDWSWINKAYFKNLHSNSFIDINRDNSADIILSSGGKFAYLFADPDQSKNFGESNQKNFSDTRDNYEYGQSSMVDINADGKIDHLVPRCTTESVRRCDITVIYENGHNETVLDFHAKNYQLEKIKFGKHYEFPMALRASDLDGDGYTDFVTVARNMTDLKNKVIYLHNIPRPNWTKPDGSITGAKSMSRAFEIQEIPVNDKDVHLVTLFDINEDGKVDLLVGSSNGEINGKPSNMEVQAIMNTQMVDACFMKVLVTNGYCSADAGSNGQSARGPFICFELSQNDGKKMEGCAGQLAQSSHFALQQPYVIFGLGQTPHFVEILNVSIPGFGPDKRVRTRVLEQIVPDAQIIIIPRNRDSPSSWDYKMFLSPLSDLVFSTLIALAVLCLLILFIIFILHRKETLEDAAEHEEYKRHWPESR